jgi:CheY-like chemotaxis protein
MLGLIEIAKMTGRTDDLGMALTSGRQLGRLLGDLLDLSALESGSITLSIGPTQLGRLLDDLVGEDGRDAVEVAIDVPPWMRLDETRIKQIIRNLLSNAQRYAPGTPARVEATFTDGWLELRVLDRGPGLPTGTVTLFEPFVQGQDGASSGLGLGLAIVAEIVECWGGTVAADAREGGGTVMTVRLPSEACDAPDDSVPHAFADNPGLVLVVEDDPTLTLVLASLLKYLGYSVECVSTGEDGLRRIREEPDFVAAILDWHLPGLEGPQVARAVREDGNALPLIAVTARSNREDVETCLSAGFDAHVAKPVDMKALGAALNALLTP